MKRCYSCMKPMQDEDVFCPSCGYKLNSETLAGVHLIPGTKLHNRYMIGKVVGHGGFGVTYVAWDEQLNCKVAIKEYMPSEFSSHMPGNSELTVFGGEKREQFGSGKKKFIEEAKRLAEFQKEDGIVTVFECFEENNTAYIVMEFLEGETLSEYLKKRGTISENEAIDMLMPVMNSLKALHKEGLIHRDIAPDNIFITREGLVKLIDFGAARYETTTHSRSLTVIVKAGYSPQEQYMSRGDQGPHTDVYALAATLYKMITGETPPESWNRRVKCENENKDPLIPPHKLTKKISKAHEVAILNAMNIRIDRRTQDVETFISELYANPPAKRKPDYIKKLDFYSLPTWFKITVPVLIVAVVTYIALVLTGVIEPPPTPWTPSVPEGYTRVPDVLKREKEQATEIIEKNDLLVYYGHSVETEYVNAGMVITQDPLGKRVVEKGSSVTLCIAYGQVVEAVDGKATVPYLCEMSLEDAIQNINKAGLKYNETSTEYVYDDYVEEGWVCYQSLEFNTTVDEGTEVILKVSKGSEPFDMPDLVGMSYENAESLLVEKGVRVNSNKVYGQDSEIGKVLAQSIKVGSKVKKGDEVTLEVCTGTDNKDVKGLVMVPDVVGKTENEARQILSNAGFQKIRRVESDDNNFEAGYVSSQSPQASSMQEKNTDITIIISKGSPEIIITFNPNGGKTSLETKRVKAGAEYGNFPEATRDSYSFVGWFTSASGGSQVYESSKVGNESITVYAHWSQNTRNLIFDANGGTVYQTSKSVEQGKPYGELPTPSKDYYTFIGWCDSSSGSKVDSNTIMGNSDVNLKAQWKENAISDWTIESDMPVGAKIVDEEWRYTKTTWKTSTNPNEAGYTVDESKTERHEAEWGPWSDWSTNKVTEIAGKRHVHTEVRNEKGPDEIVRYRMAEYNYRSYDGTRYYWPHEVNTSEHGYDPNYYFGRQAWYSKEEVDACQKIPPGGYMGGGNNGYNASTQTGYALRCDESWREIDYGRNTQNTDTLIMFEVGSETKPTQISVTYYQYSDLIQNEYSIYHLYKKVEMISSTIITEDDSISEVRHFVKYISK